jgi:hypothetical protein
MKMQKQDLFRKLIEEGDLKISGLDKNDKTYRVFKFQDKEFKLTLEVIN